ncbi:MAG: trypsin-like peptidase domain-containing protein [Treponema sp.]|nr:trypsin-like peptidase domain-containing protein [Treponema sp.]
MKLYSRGQVIFYSILTGLIVVLIAMGAGLWVKIDSSGGKLTKTAGNPENVSVSAEKEKPVTPLSTDPNGKIDALPVNTTDTIYYNEDERQNIAIYEKLNSGVVNITTETMAYNWFLEPVPREGGSGSGSIIDQRGYILTNNHVIQNAYKVIINLSDGSQYEGTVVGTDSDTDLAVLKFEPAKGSTLQVIPYGDSDVLKVGQKVLAIGNPFGFERTLTVGIVSGLGRPIEITRNHIVKDMIQTDASINPGNSGGPLLDTRGTMIGINAMIYSPSGASAGVGFAVPVNIAKKVVTELIQFGKVRRGDIDASLILLTPQLVRYAKIPVSNGILVSQVNKNGFAEKAGLKQGSERVQSGRSIFFLGGDIITAINGQKIATWADYYTALENSKPGDKVKVDIMRGQKAMTLDVTLANRDDTAAQ